MAIFIPLRSLGTVIREPSSIEKSPKQPSPAPQVTLASPRSSYQPFAAPPDPKITLKTRRSISVLCVDLADLNIKSSKSLTRLTTTSQGTTTIDGGSWSLVWNF